MNACTIIAKNYVAQARVLARSFAEHHPDGRFWTLIIDDFDGYIDPASEPFEILRPDQIGCHEFDDMAARYSVLELSTAVKPWLLRHLMGETGEPVTYLDPDIKVFGALDRLSELAAQHGVVLIPHNAEPIPPDGRRPSQIDIMVAGVYNLGYVSLAPRADVERLLDWWADRLRRDCLVDPRYGYFVDQRWFDLTPGFLTDFAILREVEYNVAYWNLHSRRLEHDGKRYLVDGRPLAFFHFSGFDPERPAELSKYQDRLRLKDYPVLSRICREYAAEARREGFSRARHWPYGFDRMPSGIPFDNSLRQLYTIGEARGEVTVPPFSEDGEREFMRWLGEPAPGGPPGMHRLLAHLYATHAELREGFPDLTGPDLGRILDWARRSGKDMVPAMAYLPLPKEAAPFMADARRPQLPAEIWGVNVVGYFRSELGVGEAARQVIGALDARGVPVLPLHGDTIPLSRQEHPYTMFDHGDAEYPVNLICMNADALPEFVGQAGESFFAGRYSIGLWFWEVSRFRKEWMRSFEALNEVWLPTAHVAEAIAAVSPLPTRTMRIPVEMPPIIPRSRGELGVPDGFMFLFSYDYRSVFERKNPLEVIAAFKRAFQPGEGASLVMKCINAEADPDNHVRVLNAAAEHSDVHVVDRYFSPQDKNTLTAICDCYVSLHRSEGFGLTMAEAMFCGKPVIATGYSGNLDFMTPENSLIVRHELVPIGPDAYPYPPDGEWAQPDVEHAATLMRKVFEDREFARLLGARAAEDIRRTHSPVAAGEMMVSRLEQIRATRDSWGEEPGRRWPLPLRSLRRRVERGSGGYAPRNRVKRKLRAGALRAMRPYTAYQEGVNGDAARALDTLGRELDLTRGRTVRSTSAVLASMRRYEPLLSLPEIVAAQSAVVEELKSSGAGNLLETDRAIYLAVSELRRAHEGIAMTPRENQQPTELTPWELRAYSQNGEDGVLAEILARVGAPTRYFIEFGIESGREGNCVFLADVAGWSGLFIEGEWASFGELERKYRSNPKVTTLRATVTPENVQALFRSAEVPAEPDVLSIDVDGTDYWIWDAITDYQPRVVVIEYNSALDPARRLVQPRDVEQWDGTEYFGASVGAMRALGESKGYRLVHTELSGVNAFLVRADLAEGRFPAPDEVPVRNLPNYFQTGYRHPPDPHSRRYLDVDTGALVEPSDRGSADDLDPVQPAIAQ